MFSSYFFEMTNENSLPKTTTFANSMRNLREATYCHFHAGLRYLKPYGLYIVQDSTTLLNENM